jgi:CRISPR/Cas system CMR-associated protein Cmr1 (group 7 of RAMP superfamily)
MVTLFVNNTFNVDNVFIATDLISSSPRDNDKDITIIILIITIHEGTEKQHWALLAYIRKVLM